MALSLTAFRTEANKDTLAIYAGDSPSPTRLLAVLSGSPSLGVYHADVADLFLVFSSDESVSLTGFTAALSSTPISTWYLSTSCPGPTNVSVGAPFNSLAVASAAQYDNNMNCSVVLVSPLATVVTLTLTRWVDMRAWFANDQCHAVGRPVLQ